MFSDYNYLQKYAIAERFTARPSWIFTTPVYVLYVLYVTKTTQSKVVGALRAPTNERIFSLVLAFATNLLSAK
jgi:hypothetical protein